MIKIYFKCKESYINSYSHPKVTKGCYYILLCCYIFTL